jgi:hypothetical protein
MHVIEQLAGVLTREHNDDRPHVKDR